jgi:hypothetical protein
MTAAPAQERRNNRPAMILLAVSVLVGVAALFALPALQSLGLSFWVAFWGLIAVEFLAAIGVTYAVLELRTDVERL